MPSTKFSPGEIKRYERGGYRFIGKNKHSALQVCRWARSSLRGKRNCYKKIFGITSHRCIQITPALDFCPFSCVFCWRSFSSDRFRSTKTWDSPKEIVEDAIIQQKKYLSGFKASKYVSKKHFDEAMSPNHFAISLDGEPATYPHLAELVEEIKSYGATVFVLTNGTNPNRIKELLDKDAIPDNLSLTLIATNEEDYKSITKSRIPNPLKKVKQSIKLLKKFKDVRTNIRLTLVKSLNMSNPKAYAKLILSGNPKFITIKGYTWIGASKRRLNESDMPAMAELKSFASEIMKHTKYLLFNEDKVSRVIILIKDKSVIKFNKEKIKEQKERWKNAHSI